MLPAFIQINSGIFSKNGFSYEYHYDFNQLAALAISQNERQVVSAFKR